MSKKYPETLSVGEVAELLNISFQEVRQMCRRGEIKATQTVPGSGKWSIKSEQFIHLDAWQTYLEKVEKQKKASLELVTLLLDILKDK